MDLLAEFIQIASTSIVPRFYRLIWQIWEEETMPEDYSSGIIIQIFKKADKAVITQESRCLKQDIVNLRT